MAALLDLHPDPTTRSLSACTSCTGILDRMHAGAGVRCRPVNTPP